MICKIEIMVGVKHLWRRCGIATANRATRMQTQPHINAWHVERVHALWQRPQLLTVFQAHRTCVAIIVTIT